MAELPFRAEENTTPLPILPCTATPDAPSGQLHVQNLTPTMFIRIRASDFPHPDEPTPSELNDSDQENIALPISTVPHTNPFTYLMIFIKVVDFGLLFLYLSALFLSLPLLLVPVGFFFLLSQPVLAFLILLVLFALGVPGSDFKVIYPSPSVFHTLHSLFQGERVVLHVGLNHGLPAEIPLSVLEVGTYCPGQVLNDVWHLL